MKPLLYSLTFYYSLTQFNSLDGLSGFSKMKLFDLSYQLAYYKAYHMHPKNVNIHIVCIPLILASAIVMLTNYSFIIYPLLAIYSTYYIILDRTAGLIGSSYLFAVYRISTFLYASYPERNVFYGALVVHISGWAAQFYGHFHHEKKSPAVFDNLVQPLVLAPYFVVFELLFMSGMHKDLEKNMLRQAKQIRNGLQS